VPHQLQVDSSGFKWIPGPISFCGIFLLDSMSFILDFFPVDSSGFQRIQVDSSGLKWTLEEIF